MEAPQISIQLADETERRLREAANAFRIPVDQLAAAAHRDFVTQPADDFEAAAYCVP
jgi:predicted transcriptional regulator